MGSGTTSRKRDHVMVPKMIGRKLGEMVGRGLFFRPNYDRIQLIYARSGEIYLNKSPAGKLSTGKEKVLKTSPMRV